MATDGNCELEWKERCLLYATRASMRVAHARDDAEHNLRSALSESAPALGTLRVAASSQYSYDPFANSDKRSEHTRMPVAWADVTTLEQNCYCPALWIVSMIARLCSIGCLRTSRDTAQGIRLRTSNTPPKHTIDKIS